MSNVGAGASTFIGNSSVNSIYVNNHSRLDTAIGSMQTIVSN